MPATDSPVQSSQPVLPLQGMVVLVVEDSRYAAESMRLMAQRSGARMRRAASLFEARRHLGTYNPDVALIDLGLPDGTGLDLVAELAAARQETRPWLVAISGDGTLAPAARAAGADSFIEKPFASVQAFHATILRHRPPEQPGARPPPLPIPDPDPLALREDLTLAASLLETEISDQDRAYLARFLIGIARSCDDDLLGRAAAELPGGCTAGLDRLRGVVALRLGQVPRAFDCAPRPDPAPSPIWPFGLGR